MAKVLTTEGLTREARREATAASVSSSFTAVTFTDRVAIGDASELEPLVEQILAANPGQVDAYRGGKEGLLGFYVAQLRRETQGKAAPTDVPQQIPEKLSA
jgi:Asp-tRNA(Asn)/Glu-tRNA(Gln) amidotransferase B subunit